MDSTLRGSAWANLLRVLRRCTVPPVFEAMTANHWAAHDREEVAFPVDQVPVEVKSVILFGSRARGDEDQASDTDVVAFADVARADALMRIHESLLSAWASEGPEVTLYSTVTAVE